MKWFENPPKLTEREFEKDSDFCRFEWRLINGLWVNIYREWVEVNGVLVLKGSK